MTHATGPTHRRIKESIADALMQDILEWEAEPVRESKAPPSWPPPLPFLVGMSGPTSCATDTYSVTGLTRDEVEVVAKALASAPLETHVSRLPSNKKRQGQPSPQREEPLARKRAQIE